MYDTMNLETAAAAEHKGGGGSDRTGTDMGREDDNLAGGCGLTMAQTTGQREVSFTDMGPNGCQPRP